MLKKWMTAMWDGLCLRCPKCRQGKMHSKFFEPHEKCPVCGVKFQPNEGDFIGAMVVAYSVLAVLVTYGFFMLWMLTDLTWDQHVWVWTIFSTLYMIFLYRNMKGLWVGILYAMSDLKPLN